MRIFLTVTWAVCLFVFTCSFDFNALLHHHRADFRLNPSPDWSELLKLDLQWSSEAWINRKIGHFIGFFLLELLLSNLRGSKLAVMTAILYAALTEVLQLYFFRSGRIYDIVNDTFGILCAYLFCLMLQAYIKRTNRARTAARPPRSALPSDKKQTR
ncbi:MULTISPECIES: VanZ family protein [Paenibacillus]|uniref:VanZ family protein n=1 Tax=Paenibacillus TaxID=44249 RepID=UPI000E27790D|nr:MULTISPECIES: VanZ family protein [Paenibacillus]MCM2996618.1 VanZ family protein [Paenibacillus cellulositrophicus]RED37049.1 VanZ like protein [Paenibacillus sp. VMFN-D1]